VTLNALVRRAVLALALIVVVMVIAVATNTRNNMANIITDFIGGVADLWTQGPTNIKEYIISKDDLKNINLLDEFTYQTKMIESSGGTNTVNEDSSALGDFQFLTRDHLTKDGKQRFNKEGDPLISSYQVGLNRLTAMYEDMGGVPEWVPQAKENNNPLDLTSKQQEELFLANLWKQKGTSDLFKRIDEGDGLAKYDLYAKYHYMGEPDQATIDVALSEYNLNDKE
jgi:hypothetical protein